MARAHTILQSQYPYHVGARCINQEWFSLPMDFVWEVMCEHLHFIHHAFGVHILAFVLMDNHFHLLIYTPRANLSEAMAWFMRETSRTLTRAGNRINQTYGGRYYRCVISTHHYYLNAYKYLYHNPVHAGICSNVLDYPYSTLPGLLGHQKLVIPVRHDDTLFNDLDGTIRWINKRPTQENWETVGRALHRKEFKLPRQNGRLHSLEIDSL